MVSLVAWRKECEAVSHNDMGHWKSDHEQSETRTILHALDGAADGATDL